MSGASFIPANKLEEVLVAACTDPSARPEFYRLLFESELFVLTPDAPAQEGRRTLAAAETISFVNLAGPNGPYLPIFTSQQRLQECVNQIGQTYGFLALTGKNLFRLLAQNPSAAVLNPGAAYGKELTAEEVKRIADGTVARSEHRVVQKDTQVLIGQPSKYPTELVAALQKLFAKNSSVHAAYLAQIHDPSTGEPPHLIVGIECSDMQSVIREAGITSQGLVGGGEFVDFIEVGGGKGSLDSYFKGRTKPFYNASAKKPFWKIW